MLKKLLAVLLCLCMVLTMLPVSAMAAVGDLLGNTPEQNASLLEKLESFTGESAEEAQQLLDSLGLLDEDGNLITDQTIDLDGKQYTLKEMEALLADPSTDLTRVAQVDGVPIALGDLKTIMAGLACGEPNILSWDILRNHVSAFVSCPDWVSARGMRMLGVPVKGDPTVISGESGAVGMGLIAALMETDEYQDLREAIGLDRFSQVLLFSTEGNTDPMKFRKVLWDGEYPTPDSPQKDY